MINKTQRRQYQAHNIPQGHPPEHVTGSCDVRESNIFNMYRKHSDLGKGVSNFYLGPSFHFRAKNG